ncbi:hypothetical protein Sjap_008664 [Stephania japonica]|uniref:Uncharacterized protein n=1 Tax=Stephania japonica TaxID=461633 RepID=A0AAP0PEU7_9MAGN
MDQGCNFPLVTLVGALVFPYPTPHSTQLSPTPPSVEEALRSAGLEAMTRPVARDGVVPQRGDGGTAAAYASNA